MSSSSENSTVSHSPQQDYGAQVSIWISCGALATNILVGLPCNVWVLWLIMRRGAGALSSDIFSLNLAALEVAYCLHIPAVLLNYIVFILSLTTPLMFFAGLVLAGRPLFQCCMCVERYLAVVHPLTFLRYRPLRYRLGCSGCVWLLTLGGCCAFVLIEVDMLTYVILALALVLLAVQSYCCLSVLSTLWHSGPGEGQREGEGPSLAKRRAFSIIAVILVSTAGNCLRLIVVNLLGLRHLGGAFYLSLTVCLALYMFSSFIQPLHFLSRAGKLQCIMGATPANS